MSPTLYLHWWEGSHNSYVNTLTALGDLGYKLQQINKAVEIKF